MMLPVMSISEGPGGRSERQREDEYRAFTLPKHPLHEG